MSYNAQVLRGLKAWDEDPANDEFDYRYYVSRFECGTTMCYGGKLAVDAGAEVIWQGPLLHVSNRPFAVSCRWRGSERRINDVAAEIAGLSEPEADALFSMNLGDDVQELEAMCARDFLSVLVRRAEAGIRNMTEEEVDAWITAWESDEEGYREQR